MGTLLRLTGGLLGTGLFCWVGYGGSVYVKAEAAWKALCEDALPMPESDQKVASPSGPTIEGAAAAYIRDHGSRSEAIQALVDAFGQDTSQPLDRRAHLLQGEGAREALAILRRCTAGEANSLGVNPSVVAADLPKLVSGAILKDLALLKAQERLDAGQGAEALRLFVDVLHLAEDHSELPLLITHAIGQSIATWALQGVQGRALDLSQFQPRERSGLRDALVALEPAFGPTIELLRKEARMFQASVASQERPGALAGAFRAMTHPGETHQAIEAFRAYTQVLSLAEALAATGPDDFPSLDAQLAELGQQMPGSFSIASSTRSILREDARTQTLIRAWINALALDVGDAAPFPLDAYGAPFRTDTAPGTITIRTQSDTSAANNDRPIIVQLARSK